jgi:hypothetical protein
MIDDEVELVPRLDLMQVDARRERFEIISRRLRGYARSAQ